MKRHKQKDTNTRDRFNLQLESLEARQMLAADLIELQPIADPFAKDAVTIEQVEKRAETESYVPGELFVAVNVESVDPNLHTVLQPTWSFHLDQDLTTPTKTIMKFESDSSNSFQLVHINMGADVDVMDVMAKLNASHDVLWTQPNFIHQGPDPREYTPNDPQYPNQYHHTRMGNDVAWDSGFASSDIVIGITDDGVDIQHEDLANSIWVNPGEVPGDGIDNDNNGYIDDVNGWNFLNDNNNPDALSGDDHGTHVSGIAAGIADNGIGIAGTASGATILPLKWYDGDTWTAAIIAETFTYAADNGVDIVNTSYNMDGWANDAVVHAAFGYMYDAGVLHFNSAGNGNALNPARQVFEETLLVASTTSTDARSSFSNYGTGIDISSPGTDILSTTPGDTYSTFSGTSMATPNAAGVAALIWSANPTWTREQVVAQLMATSDNIDSQNAAFVNLLGTGRVNSGRGVSESIAAPQVTFVGNIPESGFATATDMIDSFSVVFNQFMSPTSVTDGASYELRDAGADGSFDTGDDQVFTLDVTDEYAVGTNGIDIDILGGPLGIGEYRFSILSGGAENPFDTALDGDADGTAGGNYERFFSISIEPFVATGLAGGLGSVSSGNPGSLGGVADADAYNFFVEAGESVTALIRPLDPGATLSGSFSGGGGTSGSASAAAAGEALIVPLTAVNSSGNVTLQVTGDMQTAYTFDVYRNVNIEDVADTTTGAVDIQDSYMDLGSGRMAAFGQSNGLMAGQQFLHSNDPTKFIDISSTGTALGLTDDAEATITTTVGNSAFPAGNVTVGNNGGIIAAASEDLGSGNGALPNSAWPTALLPFWDDVDADTGDVYWQETVVNGINTLIVQWHDRPRFSNVGDATFQVQVFGSGPVLARFAYQDVEFGNPTFDFGASATIGYQQDKSNAVSFSFNTASIANGDVLDLVDTASTPDVEEYTFAATSGTSIDVILAGTSRSFSPDTLELLDENSNVVATGTDSFNGNNIANADLAIAGFVPASSGTYTVRLTTLQTATYSLIVADDLVFDLESNNAISTARPLDNVNGAFGGMDGGTLSHTQYNDASAFVDISATGTALGLTDDLEATITTTVGNSIFPAGSITVGNNGGIIGEAGEDLAAGNSSLPQTAWNTALLPFWDDIDDNTGNVYWQETQINGVDALIVQWHDRPHFNNVGSGTFQVQVFASGSVAARFAYQDVVFGGTFDNGASATVGVQVDGNGYTVSQDSASIFDGDVIDIALNEEDVYSYTLAEGETVLVETSTPLDNPMNMVANELDPAVAILDASGTSVAFDSNSAADGKNARLIFRAPTAGTYYVAVSSESGSGTYVVSVDGVDPASGDFNSDGLHNCLDINMLSADVATDGHSPMFDMNGDTVVDAADRDAWLSVAGSINGLGGAYPLGDMNLDGTTDGGDFDIWSANKFTSNNAYCSGDLNMDGSIGSHDFLIWNQNKTIAASVKTTGQLEVGETGQVQLVSAGTLAAANSPQTTQFVPVIPAEIDFAFADFDSADTQVDVDLDENEELATRLFEDAFAVL